MTSLAALPGFLLHFVLALLLLAASLAVYMRLTPHDEIGLIRAGNTGAAITLAGAVVGLALPLGSAFSHSINLLDAVVWGLVALAAQLAVFALATRVLLPDWRAAMEQRGEAGPAVLKAGLAVGTGLLNAACLST